MTEQPLLISTSCGPVAALVTWPDGPATGGAIMSPGWEMTRSHGNQLLTRTARSLADIGIASLRADHAGHGESWDVDPARQIDASREVACWFDHEIGGVPTVLLAVCFGLAHIAAICGDVTSVVGSALVNPPPLELPENIAQWRREMRRRVVRSAVRRPATVPRRVAYRFRYGPGPQWQTDHIDAFRPDGHLRALVEHGPLWVLANEDEPMTSELRDIIQNNDWASGIELTTTRIGVRPPRSLEARDLIERGLVNWAAQCLSRATSEPSERA